jgi:Secretion system C-terminal sorting domain/SdrD B-like domain
MRTKFSIFLVLVTFLLFTNLNAQVCIDHDNNPSFVPDFSRVHSDGRQSHWIDLELIHDGSTPIDFTVGCVNGSVVYLSNGTLQPNVVNSVLIQVLLPAGETEALLNYTILTPGITNNCPGNFVSPLPSVPVCLEILSGQEIDCIVDNDGIGIDGDIHVYQMQVLNNDLGPFEFSLMTTQDLSVDYHPEEYILPGQTKTVTYYIRSNSGVPASGEISFIFEGQNFTSGCEAPNFLTFEPCEVPVCLEFGAVDYDGCGGNPDGTVSHTFNANVINASNLPLQYTILPLSGGSILGGTSRTITANTTEFISFDYITNPSNTIFHFNIEMETAGVVNGCEEVIQLTLPNCGTQGTKGSMSLFAFFDQNNNGEADVTENGLSGIEFRVTNMGTGVLQTVTTNALGQAIAVDLEPGLYLVNQEVNLPWIVTKPVAGALNNVLVTAGETTTLDFANYHPNASIEPIKIHNLDAVCLAEQSNGENVYKIYGQMSTSFNDVSNLSVRDFQSQTASNLAIGQVPPLGSYIPFSFDYITDQDSVDMVFFLTTNLTAARDTFKIILPACCYSGGGFSTDTIRPCESVKVSYGTFVPAGNNVRLGEITVKDFQPCTNKIVFQSDANITTNGIYEINGTRFQQGTNEFAILPTDKILTFYIDALNNTGNFHILSMGCQDTCKQTFSLGNNFTNLPSVEIVQETPDFSNLYGATFSIKKILSNETPKYISFGFADINTNAKLLGVTSSNYYYFDGREGLLYLDDVKNDRRQVHMTLSDYHDYDALKFNFIYTSTRKDESIRYMVYAANGTLLGSGDYTLDGDKVISKIDDVDISEDAINIYPNPARDVINVSVKAKISPSGLPYKITDIHGKSIRQGAIRTQEEKIDISILTTGQYILHISETNGLSTQIKFLKVK